MTAMTLHLWGLPLFFKIRGRKKNMIILRQKIEELKKAQLAIDLFAIIVGETIIQAVREKRRSADTA